MTYHAIDLEALPSYSSPSFDLDGGDWCPSVSSCVDHYPVTSRVTRASLPGVACYLGSVVAEGPCRSPIKERGSRSLGASPLVITSSWHRAKRPVEALVRSSPHPRRGDFPVKGAFFLVQYLASTRLGGSSPPHLRSVPRIPHDLKSPPIGPRKSGQHRRPDDHLR